MNAESLPVKGLRRRQHRDLPITRLVPNMLTLMSLCSGLTAIRFALHENWERAVLAIVFAAAFDVLDGRVARMLNITSKFGAELDSLSDAISFGVAPGLVMYLWTMKDVASLGWIAVLIFAVCGALRLARFNTMLEDEDVPVWAKRFFTGVPMPAGAGLALLPLIFTLEFGDGFHLPPWAVACLMIAIGGLMVSRLPTFALKGWRIAPIWVAPTLVLTVAVVAGLISEPWLTLSGVGSLYALVLPFSWASYRNRARRELKEAVA